MKSPFIGMDPYLEARWRDIHQRVVLYASDALAPQLPRDHRARIEEQVYFEADDEDAHRAYPDVRVIERPPRTAGPLVPQQAGVATPVMVPFTTEAATDGFLEIIDVSTGGSVVTVIEVLSPSTKRSTRGLAQYRRKQHRLVRAAVNVVEIDLLRGGNRITLRGPADLPPQRRSPCLVSVWRAAESEHVALYPIQLQDRLPRLVIPLRERDADVVLDLQPLIERAYEMGGHDDIDYRVAPAPPPLDESDAGWIDDRLRASGHRSGAGEDNVNG